MSSNAVALAWPLLSVLIDCTRKTFATILSDPKLWKKVLSSLIEIAYNFLYEDVGLSKTESRQIFKYQKFLDKLAAKGGLKSKKCLFRKRNLLLRKYSAVRALIAPLNGSLNHLVKNGNENNETV